MQYQTAFQVSTDMKRAKPTIKQENTDNGENQIGTTDQTANNSEHQRTTNEQNAS